MIEKWFHEFEISQPSEYFLEHPTDDSDLQSNIQTTFEFMLTTFEIFDLPEGYMDGKGHFSEEKNSKSAAAKARAKK